MEKKKIAYAVTFIIFFIGMILVLVGTLYARDGPHIEPETPEKLEWWKKEVIYQIYPRSFKDSDDDGVGDIQGIITKIEYLKELGIGCIWLNSIYKSPMVDYGYDVSNYMEIDPIFGNIEDFKHLVQELHKNGIKIVVDFVPNHTSDEHEWFQMAIKGDPKYHDYYVWLEPKSYQDNKPRPPNNWQNILEETTWNCNRMNNSCYYHKFLDQQPDLNLRSPSVLDEMEKILKFWLDLNVDGFRIDAAMHLVENEDFKDNPEYTDIHGDIRINDTNTVHQPETYEILKKWRHILHIYQDKFLVVEIYDDNIVPLMKYYGTKEEPISDMPFNFLIISQIKDRNSLTGYLLFNLISDWLDNLPEKMWPNWVLGNHDQSRIATRLGIDLIDAFNMMIMLLPGTPFTYYGEEIGMSDKTENVIKYHENENFYKDFRDPERTPMQWDNSTLAGFTSGPTSWLPVNDNYLEVNVDEQMEKEFSHLNIYKKLTKLRQHSVFQRGDIAFPHVMEDLFSFIRSDGTEMYMVAINTSKEKLIINLHHHSNFPLPDKATLILKSSETEQKNTKSPGDELDLKEIQFAAGEGIVFKFIT